LICGGKINNEEYVADWKIYLGLRGKNKWVIMP
jgi:hypothetical protein